MKVWSCWLQLWYVRAYRTKPASRVWLEDYCQKPQEKLVCESSIIIDARRDLINPTNRWRIPPPSFTPPRPLSLPSDNWRRGNLLDVMLRVSCRGDARIGPRCALARRSNGGRIWRRAGVRGQLTTVIGQSKVHAFSVDGGSKAKSDGQFTAGSDDLRRNHHPHLSFCCATSMSH